MPEGVPENSVAFFTQNGHDHDGENSTKLDLSKYDLTDIISIEDLEQRIRNIVNSGTLSPDGGIVINPGVPGQPPRHLSPTVPGPATGLTAATGVNEDGTMNMGVHWNPVDGAESYILQLYRSVDSGTTYIKVQDIVVKGTSHEFNSLGHMGQVQTTVWKLIIQGQSTAGIVGLVQILANIASAVDNVAPGAPAFTTGSGGTNFFLSFRGFLARLNEQTEGDTKWGIGQFEYSISTNNSTVSNFDSNEVESGRQTGRIISVTGLTTGTPYYLRVRAYDNSNNYSAWTYWDGVGNAGSATVTDADSFIPVEIAGTEITDGGIVTAHILADQIVANHIASDEITADHIDGNTITANELITDFALVNNAIRSATFVDTAGSEAGWKIHNDGTAQFFNNVTMHGATVKDSSFEVRDSSNNLLFHVVGSGGTVGNTSIYGNLTVGNWAAGNEGLNWNSSSNVLSIKGVVTATSGLIGGWTIGTGKIHSGTDIELGLTNQAVSVGAGRGVIRRYVTGGAGDGDLKIGIDASSGYDPVYGTAGDMLMWWDDSASLAKFSLSDKLLFDGSNLTLTDGIITSGTIQTASSGSRLMLSPINALPDVTVDTGTAQAGASTTITLKSGSSSTNDYYNELTITLTGGTGSGQVRTISDYVGSSKVATVSAVWTTNPTSSTTYSITRKTNTFLRGYTGNATEDYPGFIYYYGERDSVTHSRQWGRVAFSSPRFSATIAYTGFVFSHSDDGWGELTFGLPNHADQFVIADAGSSSTPTNTFNRGGITIVSGTPASTNNTLYADGTTLKWHGAAIGGGSGVDSIIAGSNISVSGATGDVTVSGTYTAASPLTLSSGEFGLDTENITWASSTNMGISDYSGDIANADSFLVKNHTGNPNTAGSVYWFNLSSINVSKWSNDAGYMTASSSNTLTNKAGNISQWNNDSGYITSATVSFPLSGTAGSSSAPTYGFGGSSGDSHTGMYQANNDQIGFAVGASNRMIITTAGLSSLRTLQPAGDNSYSLGLGISSYRWKNGYFSNNVYTHDGGVHVSDVSQKTDVVDSVLGLDFIKAIRPVSFKWIETEERSGVRIHHGFIAQEIETVLGSDATDMGLWCNAHQPALSKDDYPIEEDVEESHTQSLRYTEFVPILTKAIQELEARLAALEA